MGVSKRLIGAGATASGALTPSENFNVVTYTGNSSTQSITGVGFQPDFVWIKERSQAENHNWIDSTRGTSKILSSNLTGAEFTSTRFTSFDTDGFTLANNNETNDNGVTYVAWCWKANGGTTSSNTDGTVTSTVQVNEQAGFSIVNYQGAGGSSSTVGHGLSSAPELIIVKGTQQTSNWPVYSSGLSAVSKYMYLNTDGAETSSSNPDEFASTAPNSTVFSIGYSGNTNLSGSNFIAYCFHSVDSFSKFGTYTGTGAAGNLIETGFEPAFIMFKRTDSTSGWLIFDNKRNLTNPRNTRLEANNNQAEQAGSTSKFVDFYSNGFEPQVSDSEINASGGTYIYMAFAADPDTEAPTLADSFDIQTYDMTGGSDYDLSFAFKPQFVVTKTRDEGAHWSWGDIIRGNNSNLSSNDTNAVNTTNQWRVKDWYAGATSVTIAQHATTSTSNVSYAWKADDNEPTLFGGNARAVYKFEDNTNDVTGNYNSTASANITYDSSGKFNKAADFNGLQNSSASYIDISSSTTSPNSSISLWVKSSTKDSNVGNFIDAGGGSSANTGFAITRAATTGYIRLTFTNGSVGNTQVFNGTTDVCDGSWHHIVLSMANDNTFVLYLDGESHITGTRTRFTTANSHNLSNNRFGTNAASIGASSYDGLIDQVRIYNGAVSDIGVAALYAETTSDNDDLTLGAPKETIISANANAGFSIVKWEGTGTQTQIPHGLSSAPEMIISKRLDSTNNWSVYHKDLSLSHSTYPNWLYLNLYSSEQNSSSSANHPYYARPSATVIYQNTGTSESSNVDGGEYISYCFHSVSNFSKIGIYTGNGSATGPTVTTGFQPDFVMIKRTDVTGYSWYIFDSARDPSNTRSKILKANDSGSEFTVSNSIDFNATSFQLKNTDVGWNASGSDYIYMAFKIN